MKNQILIDAFLLMGIFGFLQRLFSYDKLKMVDKDASFTYSSILKVELFEYAQLIVSPNPARDVININGPTIKRIQMFDLSGKLLTDKTMYSN